MDLIEDPSLSRDLKKKKKSMISVVNLFSHIFLHYLSSILITL